MPEARGGKIAEAAAMTATEENMARRHAKNDNDQVTA